jgi:hypothetical protein
MLKLLVIGILVFVSYYMFIAEEFKGSPETQIKQAFGIKEKENPAIEMEVNEIATKFDLTGEEHAAQRQFMKMELESKEQKINTVLKDKSLTSQQKSEKIMQIQKNSNRRIASYFSVNKQDGMKIEEWLMSRKGKKTDSNNP